MSRAYTLSTHPSMVVGTVQNVLVVVWRPTAPRVADLQAGGVVLLQRARQLGRCGLLVVTHPDQSIPDDAVRRAVRDEARRLDPHLVCGATVITKEGLAGTATRAITSTLQLLARPTHPEKIVASSREAASFLVAELTRAGEKAPTADMILEACDKLTGEAWGLPAA